MPMPGTTRAMSSCLQTCSARTVWYHVGWPAPFLTSLSLINLCHSLYQVGSSIKQQAIGDKLLSGVHSAWATVLMRKSMIYYTTTALDHTHRQFESICTQIKHKHTKLPLKCVPWCCQCMWCVHGCLQHPMRTCQTSVNLQFSDTPEVNEIAMSSISRCFSSNSPAVSNGIWVQADLALRHYLFWSTVLKLNWEKHTDEIRLSSLYAISIYYENTCSPFCMIQLKRYHKQTW